MPLQPTCSECGSTQCETEPPPTESGFTGFEGANLRCESVNDVSKDGTAESESGITEFESETRPISPADRVENPVPPRVI